MQSNGFATLSRYLFVQLTSKDGVYQENRKVGFYILERKLGLYTFFLSFNSLRVGITNQMSE
ncbi:hypothetical protein GCM10007894_25700 [Paraferrimonas haliotis]|uniref:Uncharacterized protein n=1 Tax=Paraferrimonas haliotis TaxID=2013866 RepID=A0AA37TS08_9GAMM|nr:hypothetical protein GCM10007894_25700 [Paraferrimonas haliotis]